MKERALAVLIGVLIASTALAQDLKLLPHAKFTLLPKWSSCMGEASEFRCYDLSGGKALLSFEQDAITWHNQNIMLRLQLNDMKEIKQFLIQQVASLEKDKDTVWDAYSKQFKLVQETGERARKAEKRDILGGALGWFIGGLALALAAGLGLGIWAGTELQASR